MSLISASKPCPSIEKKPPQPVCLCDDLDVSFTTPAFEPCSIPVTSPGVFLWRFLNEDESIYVLDKYVTREQIKVLIDEKLESADSLLPGLLLETIDYSRANFDGNPRKTSAFVGIHYFTHVYFLRSLWRTPLETSAYFKECILRHCLEDPPSCMEVFHPMEVKPLMLFFYNEYLRYLPLLRLHCLPNYKLKFTIGTTEEP